MIMIIICYKSLKSFFELPESFCSGVCQISGFEEGGIILNFLNLDQNDYYIVIIYYRYWGIVLYVTHCLQGVVKWIITYFRISNVFLNLLSSILYSLVISREDLWISWPYDRTNAVYWFIEKLSMIFSTTPCKCT